MKVLNSYFADKADRLESTPADQIKGGRVSDPFVASTTATDKIMRVVNITAFLLSGVLLVTPRRFSAKMVDARLLRASKFLVHGYVGRKLLATVVGGAVYPAVFMGTADNYRVTAVNHLQKQGFTVRRLTLKRSGISYDAFLIGKPETLKNGNWTLNAEGNGVIAEYTVVDKVLKNAERGSNTLMINGPGVGRSGGFPTRYQMRAGWEAGMQFLENIVKAKKIGFEGWSLGGGMLSEMVIHHKFKEGAEYSFVSNRTFNYVSTAAGAMIVSPVKFVLRGLGVELDGVKAAKKLEQLEIQHIIVENPEGDGVIHEPAALSKEIGKLKHKIWIQNRQIYHNAPLPDDIQQQLDTHVRTFFNGSNVKK